MIDTPEAFEQPDKPEPPGKRFRRGRRIPVRYLAPNFITLMSLCAGVTAIRAAIEARHELAIALIVIAALLDGVDGRVARALNAQSRFGAELDSLADFVNFGVAPAIVVYTWGLAGLKGLGWIAVLVFACGMSLRLARFNAAIDDNKPKWQSNYFTGIPAPAGAIAVLLPLYLEGADLVSLRAVPTLVAVYVLVMAGLLVSTLPTFSGKLLGERIAREYVAPALVSAALVAGCLLTYPFATLTMATLLYLAVIPISWLRFRRRAKDWAEAEATRQAPTSTPHTTSATARPAPDAASSPPRNSPPH